MAFDNQGARPNYQSSIVPLTNKGKVYDDKELKHETFVGIARTDLSTVTELDFEQPRALYSQVMNQTTRERLNDNLAAHMKGNKDKRIATRQLSVFAAIDQGFSDALAGRLGMNTVEPLQVAPSDTFHQAKHNIGPAAKSQV